MITVEATAIIGRPIHEAWSFLSDLDNMPLWDPGLVEVKWQRPLAVGSVLEMRDASPVFGCSNACWSGFSGRMTDASGSGDHRRVPERTSEHRSGTTARP